MLINNNRKPYIVVFGPQNVGKSTLVGYLYTKEWSDEKFTAEEDKIKARIGSCFDSRSRLALFVDTAKDEYRNTYLDGGSKHIHIKEFGDFTVIDTPGAATQRKERYKGIFLGEVGLFLIELEEILNLLRLNKTGTIEANIDYSPIFNDFFGALYVWQKLKPSAKIFIGLTKIDYPQYTDEDVEEATQFLHKEILKRDDVPIIPMSIDVKNRTDVGITNPSSYNSVSLLDLLSELDDFSREENKSHLFLVNDKRYGNVPGQGEILRWKIISGNIHVNDKIEIVPVKYNGMITSVTALIRSMNNIHKEEIQDASDGDVVSLVLKDIRNSKKRYVKKGEMEFMKTSIGIKAGDLAEYGNCIVIDVDLNDASYSEKEAINNLKEYARVYVAWFGRMICTTNILYEKVSESHISLTLVLQGHKNLFCLPRIDGTLINDKCIIQLRQECTVDIDHPTFVTYKATIQRITMLAE